MADVYNFKVGILTVSDSCSQGLAEDRSGPNLKKLIQSDGSLGSVNRLEIVADNFTIIQSKLREWCDEIHLDVVLTTGGTGCSPTDVTPEATRSIVDKELPGMTVAMLSKSLAITPMAMLARPVCGIRSKTVIVNLPGSVKGAMECFEIVAPVLQHVLDLIQDRKSNVVMTHNIVQSGQSVDAAAVSHRSDHNHGHNVHNLSHHHHHHHQHYNHKESSGEKIDDKSQVDDSLVARRPRESPYPVVSVEEAVQTVLSEAKFFSEIEIIKFSDALGRVLAEDVFAAEPLPPFPASTKDGYAVLASDGTGSRIVLGDSTAGSEPSEDRVMSGNCLRISTGAPLPPGADAVVQVEDTRLLRSSEDGKQELQIDIFVKPTTGQDIRPIGSDIKQGDLILSCGMKLGPSELGLLATVGVTRVKCFVTPSVGVMSTGNELMEPDMPLSAGKIRDSNRTALLATLCQQGFHPVDLGIAKDNSGDVLKQLRIAFEKVDVIVTSGGVSMGEKDLIKDILTIDFGAKIHFARVQMKPGKPTTFATLIGDDGRKRLVFGLPGNPVSCVVTCHLYVIPALCQMSGEQMPLRTIIKARLEKDIFLDSRPEYHRCTLIWNTAKTCTPSVSQIANTNTVPQQTNCDDGIPLARSTGNQISSRLLSLKSANALLVLPARTEQCSRLDAGTVVNALVIGNI